MSAPLRGAVSLLWCIPVSCDSVLYFSYTAMLLFSAVFSLVPLDLVQDRFCSSAERIRRRVCELRAIVSMVGCTAERWLFR